MKYKQPGTFIDPNADARDREERRRIHNQRRQVQEWLETYPGRRQRLIREGAEKEAKLSPEDRAGRDRIVQATFDVVTKLDAEAEERSKRLLDFNEG